MVKVASLGGRLAMRDRVELVRYAIRRGLIEPWAERRRPLSDLSSRIYVEMLFSTKAEYGVRLMVELGRRSPGTNTDGDPVALSTVAEAEVLPLSYLEHLVAKLRQADLVTSVRGAHGGYRLARPPSEVAMLDIVQALEGPIAPMECFHEVREGRVLCSHETDGDRACATKLLWTRVHGGITKALAGTTLAELIEFADQRDARQPVAGQAA
jgi:Rrf2 family cysteine metabolism transcriptional repressor